MRSASLATSIVPFASDLVFTDAFAIARTQTKERGVMGFRSGYSGAVLASRGFFSGNAAAQNSPVVLPLSMCPGAESALAASSAHRQV